MRAMLPHLIEQSMRTSEAILSKSDTIVTNNESDKDNISSIPTAIDLDFRTTHDDLIKNKVKPLILVNDKLPVEEDKTCTDLISVVIEPIPQPLKFKVLLNKRRFKRKYCRRKHPVFKRSYSIA